MNANSQDLPYGLPPRPTITLGTYYPVPYMTLTEFHYAIRQLLSSYNTITLFEWIPDESSYIVEYGSRPIEEIATDDAIAIEAAYETATRFPHLFKHQQYIWCRSKLYVYWDVRYNRICFETLRVKGNKHSSSGISSLFIKYFDKLWQIQNGLKCALIEAGVDVTSTHLRDYLVCDLV